MSSGARQLVYCHQCENEWYQDEHGLTCPQCQSEFTELLEGSNSDPRAEAHLPPDVFDDDDPPLSVPEHEHPLHNHNPWAGDRGESPDNVQGPGYRFTRTGPGSFTMQMHRTISPSGNVRAAHSPSPRQGQDQMTDISSNFASMIHGILGATARGRMMGGGFTTGTAGGEFGSGGTRVTVTRATFGGPAGATFSSQTLYPRDANGPQQGVPPTDDLHRMMESFIGDMPGIDGRTVRAGGQAPDGQPHHGFPAMNPLAQLFMPFFNPAEARHGDAVWTQEALDRVISQLMEQNSMGNAPPPASQQDIASLPKVPITDDMLDPKTGEADCSICMDAVPLGEEVTRLYCGHWFHADCVGAWLREHDSCPQCRKGVVQAREEVLGRSASAPPTADSSAPESSPSWLRSPGTGRRRSSRLWRTSSSQDPHGSTAASSSMPGTPPVPGGFGLGPSQAYAAPPSPNMPLGYNTPTWSGAPQGFNAALGFDPSQAHGSPQRRPSYPSRSQSGQNQTQQQQQQDSQPQGFADRVRGLFGRGSGGS